jgi:hypothetical protein
LAVHGFFAKLPEDLEGEHAPHVAAVGRAAFIDFFFFRHNIYWASDTFKCACRLTSPNLLGDQYIGGT